MDAVERGKALGGPQQIFVRNRLMVIAPRDNPAGIASLKDLARPGLKVIGAQASVPIGAYTAALLKSASANPGYGADFATRVERNVVSREDTVRQIVARIQLGEADAAVVYTTDITTKSPTSSSAFRCQRSCKRCSLSHRRRQQEEPSWRRGVRTFVESPPAQAILARWGLSARHTDLDSTRSVSRTGRFFREDAAWAADRASVPPVDRLPRRAQPAERNEVPCGRLAGVVE